MVNYKFYPSILDRFGSYINSSQIYNKYYGFSEDPQITEEEFEKKQFNNLINSINRVPIPWEETEEMDKGTAFNEVIDCLIENRKSDKIEVEKVFETIVIGDVSGDADERWAEVIQTDRLIALSVRYNNRTFQFPFNICKKISNYLKGALTQQYCEAVISTKYGDVLLYGYIDQLLPFRSVDLKTTSKYFAYKYRNNIQKLVYPYCLQQNGIHINEFEFVVTDFKNVWNELYVFNPEKHIPELIETCERFIEFLEQNKDLITDTKIFAKE